MKTRIAFRSICLSLFLAFATHANHGVAEDLQAIARNVRWTNISLGVSIPPDLEVFVPHDADSARFAEWVYGTPNSARVSVAILPGMSGKNRIYIDRNRDRRIEEDEFVDGDADLFSSALDAQQVNGDDVIDHLRRVLLKVQAGEATIAVATVTTPLHSVQPDGSKDAKPLNVRQVDNNANGLFADPRDQIQIDLNHDGNFNPFLETFPFRPVMNIRGARWFVKADSFGKQMNFVSVTATGKVQVLAQAASEADTFTNLALTLTGEDGSVFTISDWKKGIDLPIGRYFMSVFYCSIQQGDGTEWEFTFSRDGRPIEGQMINVEEGRETIVDPIGQLVFDIQLEEFDRRTRQQKLRPRLFTESGMLINLCEKEGTTTWSGPKCYVLATDQRKRVVGQTNSGFA